MSHILAWIGTTIDVYMMSAKPTQSHAIRRGPHGSSTHRKLWRGTSSVRYERLETFSLSSAAASLSASADSSALSWCAAPAALNAARAEPATSRRLAWLAMLHAAVTFIAALRRKRARPFWQPPPPLPALPQLMLRSFWWSSEGDERSRLSEGSVLPIDLVVDDAEALPAPPGGTGSARLLPPPKRDSALTEDMANSEMLEALDCRLKLRPDRLLGERTRPLGERVSRLKDLARQEAEVSWPAASWTDAMLIEFETWPKSKTSDSVR